MTQLCDTSISLRKSIHFVCGPPPPFFCFCVCVCDERCHVWLEVDNMQMLCKFNSYEFVKSQSI